MSDDGYVLTKDTKAHQAFLELVELVGSQRAAQIVRQALHEEEKACAYRPQPGTRCGWPVSWGVQAWFRMGEERPRLTTVKVCSGHVTALIEQPPPGEWRAPWKVFKLPKGEDGR